MEKQGKLAPKGIWRVKTPTQSPNPPPPIPPSSVPQHQPQPIPPSPVPQHQPQQIPPSPVPQHQPQPIPQQQPQIPPKQWNQIEFDYTAFCHRDKDPTVRDTRSGLWQTTNYFQASEETEPQHNFNLSSVTFDKLEAKEATPKTMYAYYERWKNLCAVDKTYFLEMAYCDTRTQSVVSEKFSFCLEDILTRRQPSQPQSSFRFFDSRYGRRYFSDPFKRMLRRVVGGLLLLNKKGYDYPILACDTIVFKEGDTDCRDPKLVDFFPGDEKNKTNIWKKLAMLIEHVMKAQKVLRPMLSTDVSSFLDVLGKMNPNHIGHIIRHPALLYSFEKVLRAVHLNDVDNSLDGIDPNVIQAAIGVDWRGRAQANRYLRFMFTKNEKYGDSAYSLLRFIRNTKVHLKENIMGVPYSLSRRLRLHVLNDPEIEEQIELVFPDLLPALFLHVASDIWIIKGELDT